MRVKELLGKEVLDVNAKAIGRVIDIDFDIKQATIRAIILKAGLTKKLFVLPEDIDRIGDKVILKITGDKIQKG